MTKLNMILASLCVTLILLCGYGLYREKLANAALYAQKKLDMAAISDVQAKQAASDKAHDDQIAALQAEKQKVVTVTQIVHDLPNVLPLPQPVSQVTEKQADAANTADPSATKIEADDIIIPKADAKPLFDAQIAGKVCAVSLDKCSVDLKAQQDIDKVKDTEISQQDVALKGGTKWQRVKTAAKWSAFGGAIATVAIEVLTHK